jgi:hypothetical protein
MACISDVATERYLRAIAAELAAKLPEDQAYARRTIELMREFYEGFLAVAPSDQKPATVHKMQIVMREIA